MTAKTERYYECRLLKYFNKHYGKYDETAEYYVNPEINKWKFDIPELGIKVTLICKDDGQVIECKEVIN